MALPPAVHRIVTGHNSEGKAIIESDTKLTPLNPYTNAPLTSDSSDPFAFAVVHRTSGFPASNTEPPIEYHGKKMSLEDKVGTTCRIVDFPPIKLGEGGKLPEGFMHRTQSLDFGVVLKGRIMLELDDGVETEVEEGAVVVQRGTIHAWKNVSNEICRMLFVLVPAEKVKNESTGEYLEITPTPQLLDDETK
ncbi:hypothetical protein EPUS_04487 [Endocarpon pusillum Z07020]|uniref:Cupin type-2 domain-containing protein n=1 Tax=Endocarpon pusillum (strain Z07020 / HMAS-L-300199) TaxID=1263415 RepID=U1HFF9_ENDPU|nr:uncharacterized protein EPUS_04487 [Endocarpon pusillum Z07020]ERF68835.1 hypothetical protein EPUS_04487 [Endocarpon pusillum Z07020]